MQQKAVRWSPGVGDTVRIKESGLSGTVIKTKGVYEARFRLQVHPVIAAGGKLAPGQARAAKIASRWYGLDELEPLV